MLWPIGKQNENDLSEEEYYLFHHLLAIPVDQRYNLDDMRRIVQVLTECESVL